MNTKWIVHRSWHRARQLTGRLLARTRVGLGVFTYLMLGLSPAMADDIDIYTKPVAAGGGANSVIMFNIDTSASMKYEFETKEANNKQDCMPDCDADALAYSLLDQRFFLLADAMRGQITSLGGSYKVGIVGHDGVAGGVVFKEAKPLRSGLEPAVTVLQPLVPPTGPLEREIARGEHDVEQEAPAYSVRGGDWELDNGVTWGSGGMGSIYSFPFRASWYSSGGSVAGTGPYDWPGSSDYYFNTTTGNPEWDLWNIQYPNIGYWPYTSGNIVFDYRHASPSGEQIFYLSSDAADTVLYVLEYDVVAGKYRNIQTVAGAYSPGDNTGAPQKVCMDDPANPADNVDWKLATDGSSCVYKCGARDPNPPCLVKNRPITKPYLSVATNTNSYVSVTGLRQLLPGEMPYRIIAATKTAGASGEFTIDLQYRDRGQLFGYRGPWTGSSNEIRTGLRFEQLGIPRGASIRSAHVQMHSNWGGSLPAPLMVGIDRSGFPRDFFSLDLFSPERDINWGSVQSVPSWEVDWTDPLLWTADWALAYFERGEDQRLDVTEILRDQVASENWCGGDVALVIKGDGSDFDNNHIRQAFSFEGAANYNANGWYPGMQFHPPMLWVDWELGDAEPYSCEQAPVIERQIGSTTEDVTQQPTGEVHLDDTYVSISSNQKTGLRFTLMGIPKNAVVESVKLVLVAHETGTPSQITIRGIAEGIAGPFGAAINELNERLLHNTVIRYTPQSWVKDGAYEIDTPELRTVVQAMVNSLGWEYDGTMGFILTGNSSEMKVRSWEALPGGAENSVVRAEYGTMAPKLIVKLKAGTPMPAGKTHRRQLVEWLDGMMPSGYTSVAGSYLEMANYLKGRTALPQPGMTAGECANNVAVLVTDVFENANTYSGFDARVATVTGQANCGGGTKEAWPCLFSMLDAMYEPDQAGAAGLSADGQYYSMRTYSIGMGPLAQTGGGQLRAAANHGGGKFFAAKNSAELIQYFREIIRSVADTGATIAAPGVSVNALNKFEHLDELYYSLFKPSVLADWEGNIKRYRLKSGVITDVVGSPAVSTSDTSLFSDTARSWWSPDVDGATVTVGGAGSKLLTPDTRRMYTWFGTYGPSLNADLVDDAPEDGMGSEALWPMNQYLSPDLLGVPDTITSAAQWTRKEQAVAYLRGGTNTVSRRVFGAAIHGSPTLVNFGIDSSGQPENTVFIGDNNGVLHMIDTGAQSSDDPATNIANTGGVELFSFVPKELLKNGDPLNVQKPNVLLEDYIYGLDGTWVPWRYDEGGDGIDPADGDKVYLYGGMRRGGKNVFALDVTTVRRTSTPEEIKPKLLWAIEGGRTGTAFEKMGQSWSEPAPRWIRWGGERKRVVFFAGGYDAAVHDGDVGFSSAPQLGSQMYMVDALTGELLWWASADAAADTEVPDMKYSITATPVTMDRNGNGVADGMYFVDLAGQVFRFDFNEAAAGADDFVHGNAGVLVARLGATAPGADPLADNRRFYDMPAVAFVRSGEGGDLMIGVVSGYREEPESKSTQEIAIMFRDIGAWNMLPPARTTITLADLVDVSAVAELTGTQLAAPGWYLPLDKGKGEKGIGSPVFFNFALLFTTFVPETGEVEQACTPDVGYSRLYALNALTAAGIVDEKLDNVPENQRYLDQAMPGLGSTIQLLYMGGELTLVSGTLAMTTDEFERDDSNLLDAGNIGDLKRTRWYQVEE